MLSGEPIGTEVSGLGVARVVGAVGLHLSQIGDQAPARGIAREQEHFPGKLQRGVVVARFGDLDDVTEAIRRSRGLAAFGVVSISRPPYVIVPGSTVRFSLRVQAM